MNIMGAWRRGYTGKDVVVTILDDGIERNHPDLVQNYVSAKESRRNNSVKQIQIYRFASLV